MRRFAEIMSRISVFLGKACGVFYVAAISISIYEVFMRYALGAPTSWTAETIMTLVATAWLCCVGAVTQQRRHITVTAMELLVGDRIWYRMTNIAILLSMAAVIGLAIMLWDPMIKVIQAPQTTGSAFDPPIPTYIKTLFFFSACLYFLQLLSNILSPTKTLDRITDLGIK